MCEDKIKWDDEPDFDFSDLTHSEPKPIWAPNRNQWSEAVHERDDNTCRWCGRRNGAKWGEMGRNGAIDSIMVVAHHIIPVRICPELELNVDNGIILCIKHHGMVHGIDKASEGQELRRFVALQLYNQMIDDKSVYLKAFGAK